MRLLLAMLALLAAARASADITVPRQRRAECGARGVICIRGDLDGDGKAGDLAIIYIDEDGYLHTRSRVGGQEGNGVIHIDPYIESGRASRLHGAKLLDRSVAGIPLLAVDVDNGHCCRSWTKYLSFQRRGIRLALELLDYDETSDEVYTRDVRFEKGVAFVIEHHSTTNQHGRESRDPDREHVYRLIERVFREID